MLNSGCIEGVLQALRAHGHDAMVAEAACELFQNMGAGSVEGKKRLLKSGCIAAVKKVMAAHGEGMAVSESLMFSGSAFKLLFVFHGRC